MDIPHEMVGEIVLVTPQTDYLDASNTKDFKNGMAPLLEKHLRLVMNLGRVQIVDSSACGAFISFLRQLNAQGGDMKLCSVTRPVRTLFELVRMHRIFDIYNTCEEALKAFQV